MIFVYILLSSQILIKHWNSPLYMAMDPTVRNEGQPFPVSKTEATNWEFDPEFAPRKHITIQASDTSFLPRVLEVHPETRIIKTFAKNATRNQKFAFFPRLGGRSYIINGLGGCVTYEENSRNYVMKRCGAPNQEFELIPNGVKFEESIENPLEDSLSPVSNTHNEEREEIPDIIDPQTGIDRTSAELLINPKARGGYESRGSESWRAAGERAAMGGVASGGRSSVTGGAALGGIAARGRYTSGGGNSASGGASLGRINSGGVSGCSAKSLVGGETAIRTQNGMLVGSSGMNIMMEAGARSIMEERNKSKSGKKDISISSESTIGPNTCNLGFLHE